MNRLRPRVERDAEVSSTRDTRHEAGEQRRRGRACECMSDFVRQTLGIWTLKPRESMRQREHTIDAGGPAATASLHGVTGRLELLERHLAALGVEDDVPVLVTHGG
jgi:hypothetical protein